jgi:hypothetical protein
MRGFRRRLPASLRLRGAEESEASSTPQEGEGGEKEMKKEDKK